MPTTMPIPEQVQALTQAIRDPASYLRGRIAPPAHLPDNILCFVRRRASQLYVRPMPGRVQHHRHVLIIALRGSGHIWVDDRVFTLREGQARLVFPFQYHSYLAVCPTRICWVFLTFEMDSAPRLQNLRTAPSRRLGKLDQLLLSEILRDWTGVKSAATLQLHLATLLERLVSGKIGSPYKKDTSGLPDDSLLTRINHHILARPGRRLVLKQLAAAVGQSESHLRRRFRAATGQSLGRHLRELRLQQACSQLHCTRLPIGEIAQACGFDSIYSFSRSFRRDVGVSPRAYRRNLRGG